LRYSLNGYTVTGMTQATNDEPRRTTVTAGDRAISKEVRAEIARQKPERGLSQSRMALELFGESQAWFNRRLNGSTAFTASELLVLANYLQVDVVQFLNATKKGDGPHAPRHPFREDNVRVDLTNPCMSHRNVIVGPWPKSLPSAA